MIYDYVRNVLDAKSLKLTKIHSDKKASDMLMKVVTKEKHVYCRDGVDMEGFPMLIASRSREGKVCWVFPPLMT